MFNFNAYKLICHVCGNKLVNNHYMFDKGYCNNNLNSIHIGFDKYVVDFFFEENDDGITTKWYNIYSGEKDELTVYQYNFGWVKVYNIKMKQRYFADMVKIIDNKINIDLIFDFTKKMLFLI